MKYSHNLDMNEYRENKYNRETIYLVNTLRSRVTQSFLLFCFQIYTYVPANSHLHPTLHLET